MARNKIILMPENITEWLASCGFLFPRNEVELHRFNHLHGECDESVTGEEVDPFRILKGLPYKQSANVFPITEISDYRMVARNQSDIQSHILDKMKNNQEKKRNDNAAEEKTDQ